MISCFLMRFNFHIHMEGWGGEGRGVIVCFVVCFQATNFCEDGSIGTAACREEKSFSDNLFAKQMIFVFLRDSTFHIDMEGWGGDVIFVLLFVYRLHIFVRIEACG